MSAYIQLRAEEKFKKELDALQKMDDRPKPENWKLSPWAVVEYLMGGAKLGKTTISTKYYGPRRLIEMAVATLASDRALLLVGVPGTAKSWVAEHMAAAISGDSTLVVQATAGTDENAIRYSWNYAELLSKGPSQKAVVPSPVMHAMQTGKIVRVEELTRMNSEVQDALISILSEKVIQIPELNDQVRAQKGFNLIATANDRDRGVNPLSSALQRRFNAITMELPEDQDLEVQIILDRVKDLGMSIPLPDTELPSREIKRLVTIFSELRQGKTLDGTQKIRIPSAVMSTAEAISIVHNARILAYHFGAGQVTPADIAAHLEGAIIKSEEDKTVWEEYIQNVIKKRPDWEDLYNELTGTDE